jgi:SAM-dependent methyltransferase
MAFQAIKSLISMKDISAQLKLQGIMKLQGSLIFYNTGIDIGLFKILDTPSGLEEIAHETGIADIQLLSSLLDLGCSIGEIKRKKDKYSLKGAMAKALVENIPIREIIRETVLYHGDVAQNLGAYLKGNTKGEYLENFGGVIAESSRIMEPFIKAFIYKTVKKTKPLKILEFGCGSGEYLRYYVDINRSNSGIAIDVDTEAVAIAGKKIIENSIEENFMVQQDNIMAPSTIKDETFDLVTSFSNMHYFSDKDKITLFSAVNNMVREKGRFILATGFKTNTISSAYYDLIFSSTRGLWPLPRIDDIADQIKKAGFSRVEISNLFGESFKGIVAYK